MEVKKTKSLLSSFRWKVLVYSLPGLGKTEWASGAPNPGVVAIETGHGNGLLTIAEKNLDYVTPLSMDDIDQIASGKLFRDKDTIVVDSISSLSKGILKRFALSIPRKFGDTPKRKAGVPELDDYGVMGALTYKFLENLLLIDKNIVVLATEKYEGGTEEKPDVVIGPDLPGASMRDAPAMFDSVMRLRSRPKLRDPKDAKSRYTERYFATQTKGDGAIIKSRANLKGKAILADEEIFDLETGRGTFSDLYNKLKDAYGV